MARSACGCGEGKQALGASRGSLPSLGFVDRDRGDPSAGRRRQPEARRELVRQAKALERELARLAGIAPIPASSGNRSRMRLHRGGNCQPNAAVHRIAVTQLRMHQPAKRYITRRISEGKTKREALRALKRHLIRTIYNTMTPDPHDTPTPALAST